jgi:hypothetical protein
MVLRPEELFPAAPLCVFQKFRSESLQQAPVQVTGLEHDQTSLIQKKRMSDIAMLQQLRAAEATEVRRAASNEATAHHLN